MYCARANDVRKDAQYNSMGRCKNSHKIAFKNDIKKFEEVVLNHDFRHYTYCFIRSGTQR